MIAIKDLVFNYPKTSFTLNIPELQINSCEKIAFIGPSGCGKTTLISLIAGIYTPASGDIYIENQKLNKLSERQRRHYRISQIGFIFQEFELLNYLNVQENVLLPYYLESSLKCDREVKKRVREILAEIGLEERIFYKPQQLSQGEKQRVAIARALIHKPRFIIADEPTGNLDPQTSKTIIRLLCQQIEKNQASLIAVTHDHSLLDHFDRVYQFVEGGICEL